MSSLATEASAAGVVEPTQFKVVHPPTQRGSSSRSLDLHGIETNEGIVEHNRREVTLRKSRAGGDRNSLGGNWGDYIGLDIVVQASECEVAGRTGGVAAKGSPVHVEDEATGDRMIAIRDLTSEANLGGIGTTTFETANEGRDELQQKRARGWEVCIDGRRHDGESIREVKLMIGVENWCRANWTHTIVTDN